MTLGWCKILNDSVIYQYQSQSLSLFKIGTYIAVPTATIIQMTPTSFGIAGG